MFFGEVVELDGFEGLGDAFGAVASAWSSSTRSTAFVGRVGWRHRRGRRRSLPAHPGVEDALLLAAQLVAHPAGTWRDEAVRRHTRTLLDAATAATRGELSDAVSELRAALVNAGDLGAARS